MPRYLTIAPGILLDVTWRCADCNESEYNANSSRENPAICEGCADPNTTCDGCGEDVHKDVVTLSSDGDYEYCARCFTLNTGLDPDFHT